MPLARSFLYVPANREKFLDKAIGLVGPEAPDALLFDLEDSVPPAEKQHARDGVREYAPRVAGRRAWVRINSPDSEVGHADLEAVIGIAGIAGLFVPKVDLRDEVLRWDRTIAGLEQKRGLAAGSIKLVLSIESARGVLNAYDMATAAGRVASLAFGGAQDGDLNADLGCTWSLDGPEMLYARQHTLLAARAAKFDTPLDGVFADVRDADGFARDTVLSRRLGYRGRKLIHPSQVEPCNRLYAPTPAELDYYTRVIEAFDRAVAQGSASTIVDGRMIDVAMAHAARRVLEEAKRWSQAEDDKRGTI